MAESPVITPAWQPFTMGGVARFAYASWRRLFAICAMIALVCATTIITFVHKSYFPVIDQAITSLPEEARLQDGYLHWPGLAHSKLAANRFLSIFVNPTGEVLPREAADLQAEMGTASITFRSAVGYTPLPYPRSFTLTLNQQEMLPLWSAWKPAWLGGVALAALLGLLLSWSMLATFFFLPVMIIAYYCDRALTLGGAWRLSFAALMPGALLMCFAITLYSLGEISPLLLGVIFVAHLLTSVIYILFSPLCLDPVPDPSTLPNPFGGAKPLAKKTNPFGEPC